MSQAQPNKTVMGVGIDTHRYFHQATFLDADRQRAAPNLRLAESAEGYAQLRQALEKIAARQPNVHFHILVDAAGQYAANLERYLRRASRRKKKPRVANGTCPKSKRSPRLSPR